MCCIIVRAFAGWPARLERADVWDTLTVSVIAVAAASTYAAVHRTLFSCSYRVITIIVVVVVVVVVVI